MSSLSTSDNRNQFLVDLDDATRRLEDPHEITQTAARLLGELLHVNRCAYADVEGDEDTFNLMGDYNNGVPSIVGRYTFTQFGKECLRLMRAGEPYVVTDSETDERTSDVRESYRATSIRAVICVPVHKAGRFVAAMAVHQITPRTWTAAEIGLLERVASRSWESIERSRVTRELRARERLLRLSQRAGRIGSFEWDIRGGRVQWSAELEALYGLRPGEFGETLEEWRRRCDPSDAARILAEIEQLLATRQEAYDYEFRALLPDGSHRWLRGQAQFEYDAEGQPLRMLGVNIDIDAYRRALEQLSASEARFRGVVEVTPECVKIVGPDGTLRFMNPAGLAMIEADSEAVLLNRSILDLIAEEHRASWRTWHARVCGGETLSWEFELIGLVGTRRWMETHAVPLLLPDGSTGLLAVTREITRRKLAEAERERLLEAERVARQQAERANVLKDEFLTTLSHELRTPLNSIVGWAHLLANGNVDAAIVSQGVRVIARNARAQAQMVDDLLDMSRIMSGRLRLEVRRARLGAILQEAVDAVRPGADAKGLRMQCVFDPNAGPVSADPVRLQQVFWNLLSNAVRFTPRGGKVMVTLERVNSHLEVSVADSGEGIPSEFLPYVFDRFRQADSSTTRRHGGLGLGLAISKQLVELHGGSIRAQSAGVGAGATFTVTVPLAAVDADAAQEAPRQHPRAPADAALEEDIRLDGVTVLIVDDEPDARHVLQRVLQSRGATVSVAESSATGITFLRQHLCDVIVSDIGMPDQDGYSFLQRVRALPGRAEIPAIALTAFARSEDRIRAMLAGFQLHMAKPVEPLEFIAMVAALAGRVRAPLGGATVDSAREDSLS